MRDRTAELLLEIRRIFQSPEPGLYRPRLAWWPLFLLLGLKVPGEGGGQHRVVVMDVGQGLAVLVQTPRHAVLYDTGPAFSRRDAGATVILPMLRELGVAELDLIIVSHGDTDHSGGLNSVWRAFPQAGVIGSPGWSDTESIGTRGYRI